MEEEKSKPEQRETALRRGLRYVRKSARKAQQEAERAYNYCRRTYRRLRKAGKTRWAALTKEPLLTWAGVTAIATLIYAIGEIIIACLTNVSLQETRRAFQLSNAAYLVAGGITDLVVSANKKGFIKVQIDNVGKMPASDAQVSMRLYVRRRVPDRPQFLARHRAKVGSVFAPGIGGPVRFTVRPLNDRKYAALCAGNVAVTAFVTIAYDDGFGPARRPLKLCELWRAERGFPCTADWVSCEAGPWLD